MRKQRLREELGQLSDPHQRLREWVRYSCQVLARTSPVHAVIRCAADSDAFAVERRRRLLQRRLEGQTAIVRAYLDDALRPGLSIEEAGERFCTLSSPEPYHLLVAELGWPPGRHEVWLAQLLEAELLSP